MMGWSEVAPFTAEQNDIDEISCHILSCARMVSFLEGVGVKERTWGKRCSPPRRSPALGHLSQASSSDCPPCNRCRAGWHLSRLRMSSAAWGDRGGHLYFILFHDRVFTMINHDQMCVPHSVHQTQPTRCQQYLFVSSFSWCIHTSVANLLPLTRTSWGRGHLRGRDSNRQRRVFMSTCSFTGGLF